MLTRKNGHFTKGFPWPEEVQDLFFSIGGQLEYFDAAGDDHIEPVCILAFREDGFRFSEGLIRYDHGQVFNLPIGQTFKQGNASYVIKDRQGRIPLRREIIGWKGKDVNEQTTYDAFPPVPCGEQQILADFCWWKAPLIQCRMINRLT
jgi:hypothetical protein